MIGLQRSSNLMSQALVASAALLFLLFVGFLLLSFHGWAAEMIGAITYPFQLNYGEGIVWQQADMMMRGEGYRPLSDSSFIVFHYPPLYHVVSSIAAKAAATDWLVAGRAVSVLSTLGAACVIGGLTFRGVRSRESKATACICALVASLLVFTLSPVAYWSPFARVDMISIWLTLTGVWFGLRSVEHPRSVVPAAIFFVLAMYAKQTAITAPLATFVVLLITRPKLAWRGLLIALAIGLAVMAALSIGTSGQFLRHVVGYNANRFAFDNIGMMTYIVALHFLLFILVYFAMTGFVKDVRPGLSGLSVMSSLRVRVAANRFETLRLFAVVWFALTFLTSIAIVKSGATFNYLLEWMLSWALLIGLALPGPVRVATGIEGWRETKSAGPLRASLVFAVLAAQTAGLPTAMAVRFLNLPEPPIGRRFAEGNERDQLELMVQKIRETARPVISDDMVAVKKAGKEVIWEAAIFAELTATGQWNDQAFIEMIRQKRFGLIVTEGGADNRVFKARYSPAVVLAIDRSYPRKETLAGYRVHRPSP